MGAAPLYIFLGELLPPRVSRNAPLTWVRSSPTRSGESRNSSNSAAKRCGRGRASDG